MDRIEHNAAKLAELRPEMQGPVTAVLGRLVVQGYQPKISNAYRSAEEQRKKFAAGFSLTARPGYHHWGLAVDIIDARWGWKVTAENAAFFQALRAACDAVGLASGGWWGLKPGREKASLWLRYRLGWDPAHCQALNPPRALRVEYRGGLGARTLCTASQD